MELAQDHNEAAGHSGKRLTQAVLNHAPGINEDTYGWLIGQSIEGMPAIISQFAEVLKDVPGFLAKRGVDVLRSWRKWALTLRIHACMNRAP